MKAKKLFLIWACLLTASLSAQLKTDTIVNTGVYKSYFCYAIKEPLYVTYTLYKGGGSCDREQESFHFKKCGIKTASDKDYSGSGYDKGHLVNAEDFAYDCTMEETTFCYYNCLPQTIALNRGIWKTWEEKIRDSSQKRRLFIIAGGIYSDKTIGSNNIGVPDFCYKVVLDAKTSEVLWCLLFPNDESKRATAITLEALKRKLGYDLVP
ncbi:DNA/RNA non-specific endonuclease [Flavobacterium pallidum]|nr:DNA/RNA non-specific endonuclease [Flavobacterium pallidum]